MDWKPTFYTSAGGNEPVKDFILAQPDAAVAEILHVLKLLRLFNVTLGMPHSRKVTDNLRELRIQHGSDHYRILYCAIPERRFLLLHGLTKKADKLNESDIETAEKRLAEYSNRGGL